ncbi:MAG: GMP synthase [Acidobacteria bacterium]|nr:MAG: GMP synthase [Acidobacteriota bacterium]
MMKLRGRVDHRQRARSVPRAGATGPRPMPARGVPPILLHALPRILIIRTGSTALEVQRGHGDYDRWFRDALAAHNLAFDLCDATKSAITDASPYAGIIVTGSVKSVLKPEPWMDRLAALLRGAGHMRVPMLAVCFGCQMLARARGGRVVLSPSGWEIGAVEVTLTAAGRLDPLFEGLPSPLPVLAMHEDRVETLPSDGVLLAGNDSAPIQAFRVDESVWGVQFHPEATTGILRELIKLRRERLEAEARARGRVAEGHVDRLVEDLERFDPIPARRLLDNFVRLCRRDRSPDRMM